MKKVNVISPKSNTDTSGINADLLHQKFTEAMSDFVGASRGGWTIGNQLDTSVLVKEFEMNGQIFQCQIKVTKDEDDFM